METVALIVIGYNKVNSMVRLLASLDKADYGNDDVPLIISVDKSETDEVKKTAEQFCWRHGEKTIRCFEERQGLRKHILSCGDYLKKYDTVWVFEDDIMVSPYFYQYGKKCAEFYKNDKNIEGISLYGIKWNYNANYPFEPLKNEYDTYFLKYAQSWGQIWYRDRWTNFIQWYQKNLDFFEGDHRRNIPENLYAWGDNSWLKYHIAYCIVNNKYFVYPYYSFTTAFVEKGTHFETNITRFHTEMMVGSVTYFHFAEFNENAVRYDAFFENELLKRKIENLYDKEIDIDLYGRKETGKNTNYILSTQILPYDIKKEYGLQLRPIELNVFMDIKGKGIYLYDTSEHTHIDHKTEKCQVSQKWNYFFKDRFLMWNEIFPLCWQKVSNLFRMMFTKLRNR